MLRDNPVLTRELLVTLRSPRSFVLQLLYVCVLGALVFFQWPAGEEGARQVSPGVARTLFDIFFLGQFFLVALDGAHVRRRQHHGRKRAENLRAAPGQPAAPGDDPGRQAAQLAFLPGHPDRFQPSAHDSLLPAGRVAALGDHSQLSGLDPGGGHVRAAVGRLFELFPPDQLGAGRQLPGHPAAGGSRAWS